MRKRLAFFIPVFLLMLPNWAFGEPVWERFSEFDPDSTITIDHQPLTVALQGIVLPVGRSLKVLGNEKPKSYVNQRIKSAANLSRSRYEGNRVLFHVFSAEYVDFFLAYQEGLEGLSTRIPLKKMTKDEQLAFWLNLHNVMVINKLAAEYPIRNLKSLHSTFWQEKTVTVEDVPLSVADIEEIVIRNWDNPLVIYGLWQGSVGGPSLPNFAYDGENVWRLLEGYASEFVNSNRGAISKRGAIQASDYYQWALAAFGGSEEEVLAHIKHFSDGEFHGDISGFSQIKFKYYDWLIADILGGTLHSGGHSSDAAVLTIQGGAGETGVAAGEGGGGGIGSNVQPMQGLLNSLMSDRKGLFPPAAEDFLKGMLTYNSRPVEIPEPKTSGPEN